MAVDLSREDMELGAGGLRGIARLAAGYTVSRPTTQLVDRHGAAENV